MEQVEKKKVELKIQEKAREKEAGWFSYFFGSSKNSKEKDNLDLKDLDKLYLALDSEPSAAQESPEEAMDRAEEYYWLVGEFTLCKGVLKIQRDISSGSGNLREAIVLRYEGIRSRFMKRFKGMDLDSGIETVSLTTCSILERKTKIENVVVCRNPMSKKRPGEYLGFIKMRVLPPNTNTQFEMEASAKSLKIFYMPSIISKFMMFLGQDEVRSNTYSRFSEIKENTQGSIEAALEGKKPRIMVNIESPVLIIPIAKNKDPWSPIWRIKLGDLKVSSKVVLVQEA